MGILLNIPGFKDFINEIPDHSLILVEGEVDPIKTIFVQKMGIEAIKKGKKIIYITSREKEEIHRQFSSYNISRNNISIINGSSLSHLKEYIKENSLIIIDSFSYLMLEKDPPELKKLIETMRRACKKVGAIIFLTIEAGMLHDRLEKLLEHATDGVIQFKTKESSKGIIRFIRIPKWSNEKIIDENIYFTFDHGQINIDLRSRVA